MFLDMIELQYDVITGSKDYQNPYFDPFHLWFLTIYFRKSSIFLSININIFSKYRDEKLGNKMDISKAFEGLKKV